MDIHIFKLEIWGDATTQEIIKNFLRGFKKKN
jgi:hypothetical protein